MKAAIFGAGSLGTIMGAYLTKGGVPIELVTRNKAHVDALNQHGATVTGTVNMNVPVTALTPDQMQGPYDVLFLMTKQLDNEATVHDLEPLLAPDGVICTLQNGLPEMLISSIVGPARTMGCTVAWGATMTALGVSELTSEPDALSFGLGVFPPVPERRAHEVQQLLETMCPVELEPNFIGARYSKLLINASFSGMSAVLGSTFGEAANDKRSRVYVQRIIKECLDVADAAGIRVEPIQGTDVAKLLNYHGALKRVISFAIIPIAIKKHARLRASMLQDLEHGKRTEVDAINGSVCRLGAEHDVPTPVNDAVVELIHQMERGERTPGWDNLAALPA